MRAALPLVLALLLGAAAPSQIEITEETVGSFYREFSRLTSEPRGVSARLAALCVSPTSEELVAEEKERSGPHAFQFVHLYSHGVDPAEFTKRSRQFPVGTVVVKEKLASDLTPTGVGGMQKMEPGYDPEGGDWKYFFGSGANDFSQGPLENCRSCHLRAKESDFVYFVAPTSR